MRLRYFCSTLIFLALFALVCQTSKVFALTEFTKKLEATYTVTESGTTQVLYDLRLQNNMSTVYATEYVLEINSTEIQNVLVSNADKKPLPFTATPGINTTTIRVQFPEEQRVVGREKEQVFQISYTSQDIASQYGQVLEVSIPKLANPEDFAAYKVTVIVPQKFGKPSLVEPAQYRFEEAPGSGVVQFNNVGQQQGISVLFGESQTYELNVQYHLSNSSQNVGVVQVALPPDTAWQRLQYTTITPKPEKITKDTDGNWIAEFRLAGEDKTAVQVQALATIYAQPQPEFIVQSPFREGARQNWWTHQSNQTYLSSTEFWPVETPVIQQLSDTYQSPRAIYDYVTDTLTYNYQRFEQPDAQSRLGAVKALEDTGNAVCQEFTDVFVAIARGAGLPARRVTGFAVTQNSRLRPLSLVADVLHTWPEYYDAQRELWTPVDPTWADTTGGVDYFSKLDLRHIVFAIQGMSDSRPLPAGMYKLAGEEQKDVDVQLATSTPDYKARYAISKKQSYLPKFGFPSQETVTITNESGSAAYNVQVAFGLEGPIDLITEPTRTIPVLLPFQSEEITIELTGQHWWQADQAKLEVLIDDQRESYTISARRAIDSRWRQPWVLGVGFALLSAGAGGVLVFILHRLGFVCR